MYGGDALQVWDCVMTIHLLLQAIPPSPTVHNRTASRDFLKGVFKFLRG
jgi:hypothetical protein